MLMTTKNTVSCEASSAVAAQIQAIPLMACEAAHPKVGGRESLSEKGLAQKSAKMCTCNPCMTHDI